MPALQNKPRIDDEIVRKLLDESAAAVSAVLDRLSHVLSALADRLDPNERTTAGRETAAVLDDPGAMADLAADDLDERPWELIREELGIGANHRHDSI